MSRFLRRPPPTDLPETRRSGGSGGCSYFFVGVGLAGIALLILVALGVAAFLLINRSVPTVVIAAPASGTRANVGAEIAVQSTASDAQGITRVELLVDGVIVRSDALPAPQTSYTVIQRWIATSPGTHIIQVRAHNKAGTISDPVAIYIEVTTSVALATPSPPGRSASSPTPSSPAQLATASPMPAATMSTVTPTFIPWIYAPTIAPPQATPPGGIIQTNLPTVTMQGGTGYIFPTRQITSGPGADRDIWWNASQILPDRSKSMVSLGLISSPADVTRVSFANTADIFVPTLGEGYALKIDRDGKVSYAIFRIVAMPSERTLTFDYVYPFTGQVTP